MSMMCLANPSASIPIAVILPGCPCRSIPLSPSFPPTPDLSVTTIPQEALLLRTGEWKQAFTEGNTVKVLRVETRKIF